MKKKNRLNTYYLKLWRKKAREEWRVITTWHGFILQHYEEVKYGACEYSFFECQWVDKKFYEEKEEAYNDCRKLRYELIMSWLEIARFKKKNKVGEIY